MSVSIDRFVRVMSRGTVVSDELVQARYAKAQQGLNAVQAQIARVTQAGLQANPAFVAQLQGLQQSLAAAMQQPTNQAKCDALEPLKDRLRAAADQTKAEADAIMPIIAAMRQKANDALAAVNRADQAIQQIADPAFRAPLAARLASVQNSRINAAAANTGTQVRAAVPTLTTCVSNASAIATEAAQVAPLVADRAIKLAAVNAALANLSAINATIAEAPQKAAVDRVENGLTQQRDALGNAAADQLARHLSRVPQLLADIATATTASNLRLAWGNTLARRDVIRRDAAEYEAIGRKDGLAPLEAAAAKVTSDLAKLETLSVANPKAARDQLPTLESDYNQLKTRFGQTVSDAKLVHKVQDLAATNPNGPEAQMQTALGADRNGGDVFKQRLLAVYNSARFRGSPEINLLTPGEAVAVYTYTTNDYKQMSGYLWGKTPLDPVDPATDPLLLMPTEDQIKLKNKHAIDAIRKLPVWTGGMTRRGDKGFPNDDVMFALNNTFTIKGFWSTDKVRPFPGKWQMFVHGTSGTNVAMISAYPNEDEVLFLPGTKFKVLSRTDTKDSGGTLIRADVVVQEV